MKISKLAQPKIVLVKPKGSLRSTSGWYTPSTLPKRNEKAIKPAVNFLIKMKCKKIILGCTELPIAIFAFKSFQKIKKSKTFLDPNLILANSSMKKYKG